MEELQQEFKNLYGRPPSGLELQQYRRSRPGKYHVTAEVYADITKRIKAESNPWKRTNPQPKPSTDA